MTQQTEMGTDNSLQPAIPSGCPLKPPTNSCNDTEQASLLFRQGNFEKAAELYTKILEARSTEGIDPLDSSLASIYLHYGKCLLCLGQQEIFTKATETASSALGQAVEDASSFAIKSSSAKTPAVSKLIQLDGSEEQEDFDEIDSTTDSTEPASTGSEPAGSSENNAVVDQENSDEESNTSSLDDTVPNESEIASDDLQLAWEALDTARLIYLRQPIVDVRQHLVDAYLALGDVSMESGAFSQAKQDYEEGLRLLEEEPSDSNSTLRYRAEIYYKIALSLEYEGYFVKAGEMLRKALDLLSIVRDCTKDEGEREEMNQIIPDIEVKLEDLQASRQLQLEQSTVPGMGIILTGEKEEGGASTDTASSTTTTTATDISSMIKRKHQSGDGSSAEKKEKKDE